MKFFLQRILLSLGKVSWFAKWQKNYFYLSAIVQKGSALSRKIDFPTVNFYYENQKWSGLKAGCYQTLTIFENQTYQGLTCVLKHDENHWLVTTYIDNFFGKYFYDQRVTLLFLKFYRKNQKFTTWQKMQKTIAKDCEIQFKKFTQPREIFFQKNLNMLKLKLTIKKI